MGGEEGGVWGGGEMSSLNAYSGLAAWRGVSLSVGRKIKIPAQRTARGLGGGVRGVRGSKASGHVLTVRAGEWTRVRVERWQSSEEVVSSSTEPALPPSPPHHPTSGRTCSGRGEGGEGREGGDSSAVRYIPACLSVSRAA